ncbi:response regulator transcription factor [Paenibacillus puerhi]|uniref:response regulator transcription factor n=1 Tax=Paenibacillus puerhi TaxID=2692622 RepID=UPI001357DE8A|nr:response regulator transcription factor [Paenibacillus puerhi]
MTNKYNLLIIEDDKDLADAMRKLLDKWGYHIAICEDFEYIMKCFNEVEPHIVLLDINIPAFDGFYWCKKIREVSKVPIVFVTSRDSNMDIVMAMNSGGDDYIQKPFDSHVLVAKLQAIIRRTYEYQTVETSLIEYNQVILNLNDTKLYFGEKNVELTKNEFRILKTMMENNGKVVSRDSLMKQLWDDDLYVNENTLTVNMNRLRKKLEELGVYDFIQTKKGMGYLVP